MLHNTWAKLGIDDRYSARMGALLPAKLGTVARLPHLFAQANNITLPSDHPLILAWCLFRFAGRVLDDIQDGDRDWAVDSTKTDLNGSTGLLFTASWLLNELENYGVESAAAYDIRQHVYQLLLRVCQGQHDDLTLVEPTLEQAWEIAARKTGDFAVLATWASCRMTSADPIRLTAARQFGFALGMMSQIRDDAEDLWDRDGRQSDFVDVQANSLPVAYTRSVLGETQKLQFDRSLAAANHSQEARDLARKLIIDSGAILYLTVRSKMYLKSAYEQLDILDIRGETRDSLEAMLEQLQIVASASPK